MWNAMKLVMVVALAAAFTASCAQWRGRTADRTSSAPAATADTRSAYSSAPTTADNTVTRRADGSQGGAGGAGGSTR